MSRIRSVHPSLFTDEAWVSLSPLGRILYIGLWTDADDQGVYEWKPLQIKMRLLPGDVADVPALLAEMVEAGLVIQFDVGGKKYGAVRNFRKFQRPKKPNAIHPLPNHVAQYVGLSGDDEEPVPHQFPTSSENSPQMEDGGWRMEDGGEKIGCVELASEREVSEIGDWPEKPLAELVETAGPGLADPNKTPNLLTTSGEVARWRKGGCSFKLDVLPVVTGLTQAARAPPISTWSYFTPAIVRARDARLSGLPAPAEVIPHPSANHAERRSDIDLAVERAEQLYAQRNNA